MPLWPPHQPLARVVPGKKKRKISKVQNKAISLHWNFGGFLIFWRHGQWSMMINVCIMCFYIFYFMARFPISKVTLWAFVIFPALAMTCFSCSNSAHLFIRFRIWRCLAKDLASSTGERVTNPSKIGNGWQVQAIILQVFIGQHI